MLMLIDILRVMECEPQLAARPAGQAMRVLECYRHWQAAMPASQACAANRTLRNSGKYKCQYVLSWRATSISLAKVSPVQASVLFEGYSLES